MTTKIQVSYLAVASVDRLKGSLSTIVLPDQTLRTGKSIAQIIERIARSRT